MLGGGAGLRYSGCNVSGAGASPVSWQKPVPIKIRPKSTAMKYLSKQFSLYKSPKINIGRPKASANIDNAI